MEPHADHIFFTLLFAGWLALQHKSLDLSALEQSQASAWQQDMTHPLRALRYQLRPLHKDAPELTKLYQMMRKAELEAEKIELAHLYALANHWPASAISADVIMRDNIACLAASSGQSIDVAQQDLLTSLGRHMMLLG